MLQKIQFSPEKYRYLEWTEGRGDKGKKCTSTARKIGHIDTEKGLHMKNQNGEVISGVLQGSVLAPITFLVYVNDMIEGVSSYISLFADDAKKMKSRIHKCTH